MPASRTQTLRNATPFEPASLVENVPRRMRAGAPTIVEVRIARADVPNVGAGMRGPGAPVHHDILVSKAVSLRLRAPDGGFTIEPASPETQWIDNELSPLKDEFASWRWTVTPLRSGKARLQLVAGARTVGPDGLNAETALPDQAIEVTVAVNYGAIAGKWGGWAAAAVIGGILGKLGEGLLGGTFRLFGG